MRNMASTKKNEDRKPTLMVPLCTSACGPCLLGELLTCNVWIMNGQVRLARRKLITKTPWLITDQVTPQGLIPSQAL